MRADAECEDVVGLVLKAAFGVLVRRLVLGGDGDEDRVVGGGGFEDVVEPFGEGLGRGGGDGEDAVVVGVDGVGVVA